MKPIVYVAAFHDPLADDPDPLCYHMADKPPKGYPVAIIAKGLEFHVWVYDCSDGELDLDGLRSVAAVASYKYQNESGLKYALPGMKWIR